MRQIADILVFKTPFEKADSFAEKIRRSLTMFRDYCGNASLPVREIQNTTPTRQEQIFVDTGAQIRISFSSLANLSEFSYYPALSIRYELNESVFQTPAIENFLNDNIRFVSGVFFEEYFLDVDSKFHIESMNSGKKYSVDDLKKFDTTLPTSKENKRLLDSLLYLHYSLMKNIFDIWANTARIDALDAMDLTMDFASQKSLFEKRWDMTKALLVEQAWQIREKIDQVRILL